jgi:2-oxoisovalerate dehydrogenase E1 component alpha subunit
MAVPGAADKACGLGLDGRMVDGTDLFAVYEIMADAVKKARQGGGPTVIEARLYRITPHSSDDDDRTYRSREEVEEHKKKDPLLTVRRQLEEAGILTAEMVEDMEARAKQSIDTAVENAREAPYPTIEEGAARVYAQEVQHG